MDLKEAEEIKNRWQEYTEELYKKDLNDPDNHDSVTTHLEPDILEYEVKWAFKRIPTKLAEVKEFQLSYLKPQKMNLLKCCIHVSKSGKVRNGHRTGKDQFFIPIPKTGQCQRMYKLPWLHSLHMLVGSCSKCFKQGFSSTWTENFHMHKLGFEKAEEPEIKLLTSTGS